jgi:hypothetical protein
MAWQQFHFNFYENGKDHHLICFEDNATLEERQNDYAKSNPMNFRF